MKTRQIEKRMPAARPPQYTLGGKPSTVFLSKCIVSRMANNTSAPRALVYARVSRILDDRRTSVDDQATAGRATVAEQGWTLAGVAEDPDVSASRYARRRTRPGWDEVLAALTAGQVDVIVLWETSRGDRKLHEWIGFLDQCRDRGVLIHVISIDKTFDPRKAHDYKELATEGVTSAHETEILSGRVKRGVHSAARRGQAHPMTGYGYRRVYDEATGRFETLRIEPGEAGIVAEIIRRVGRHESLKSVREGLDARGIPAPAGGSWDPGTIRYMAQNPLYTGHVRTADGTLVKGTWPPIVAVAEWGAACAVLSAREGRRPGKQKHLLSVLAKCRECGTDMVARNRPNGLQYTCRKGCFYIDAEWLDELAEDVICARLARPDARELFRRDDKRAGEVRARIEEMERRHEDFAVRAADGRISASAFEVFEAQLNPQIGAAREELLTLTVPAVLREVIDANDVRKAWSGLDLRARRAVIAVITEVLAGKAADKRDPHNPDRVTFTWKPVHRPPRRSRPSQRRTVK